MIDYWKEIEEKNAELYPKGTYWHLKHGGVGKVVGYGFSYVVMRTWDKFNGKMTVSIHPDEIAEAANNDKYFSSKRKAIYDMIEEYESKIRELNKEFHNDKE